MQIILTEEEFNGLKKHGSSDEQFKQWIERVEKAEATFSRDVIQILANNFRSSAYMSDAQEVRKALKNAFEPLSNEIKNYPKSTAESKG